MEYADKDEKTGTPGRKKNKGVKVMLRKSLLAIGVLALLSGGAYAGDRSGGIGSLPGLDTGLGQQNIIIHDSKGGTTVGTYTRDSGTMILSGPQNQLTIGQEDSAGNIVIQQYGGDDDD